MGEVPPRDLGRSCTGFPHKTRLFLEGSHTRIRVLFCPVVVARVRLIDPDKKHPSLLTFVTRWDLLYRPWYRTFSSGHQVTTVGSVTSPGHRGSREGPPPPPVRRGWFSRVKTSLSSPTKCGSAVRDFSSPLPLVVLPRRQLRV